MHVVPQHPCHRSMIGVDIKGSTRRRDPEKAHLRRSMYEMLEKAMLAGGLAGTCRDPFLDRGDGVLVLVHPVDRAPKTVLLGTVVPAFAALLAEHNKRHPEQAYQVRVVVHAGEVSYDANGCFGEAVDVAFRLLDSEPAKRTLDATTAPMVLVVSEEIHRCVVRHGFPGIDPNAYSRMLMPPIRGLDRSGWLRVVDGATDLGEYRREA